MKKLHLKHVQIGQNYFENVQVTLDNEGRVVLLPLLFAMHLEKAGEVVRFTRQEENGEAIWKLDSRPVSESTAATYINHVYQFYKHLNNHDASDIDGVSLVHQTYICSRSQISEYLNNELASTLSGNSLLLHQSALSAFFNFLALLGLRQPHAIQVSRKARKNATDRNQPQAYINYISTKERFELLKRCRSKRDRLILRCGSELGLRAKENQGLLLEGTKTSEGLLSLFEQLNSTKLKHKERFPYRIPGKYTKRQKSRTVYISRDLLADIQDYYLTERLYISSAGRNYPDPNALFLRTDQRGIGQPISKRLPSDIFSKYKKEIPFLDQNLSYHDLRHTFATELYHSELKSQPGRETRSESAALIAVSEALGHSTDKNGRSPTTIRYIRLREIMLECEGLQK